MQIRDILDLIQYEGTKIVTVGMLSGGFILTGKRRDNGLWTSPGGHMDPGEDVMTAAIREVKEETDIDVDPSQLEFIHAQKVVSHRTGKPFVVIAFIAHVDKDKASAKNDPDKEVSEWKWVEISKSTPELKREARHAKDDFILINLGLLTLEAKMGSRKMSEVSKELQNANFDESPEPAKAPEPKAKTPEEMAQHPDTLVNESKVTGD